MSHEKFPQLEKLLGKPIEDYDYSHEIYRDLEALLNKAPRVYEQTSSGGCSQIWSGKQFDHSKETALLLCVEPIEKAVTDKDINKLINKTTSDAEFTDEAVALFERILEHGYQKGTR